MGTRFTLVEFPALLLLWKWPTQKKQSIHGKPPKVSIVICAHNEDQQLSKLISALFHQNYPTFEVILVNDRSTDNTQKILTQAKDQYPGLITLDIKKTKEGWNGKKYALQQGIQEASGEWILLTDADCLPSGKNWITSMVSSAKKQTQVVVGYSPYRPKKGLLNQLIQIETMHTALMMFIGVFFRKPYMAVGRNLMYKKEFFIRVGGFKGIEGTMGGDDDLLINRHARGEETVLSISPDSFCFSDPKTNWRQWWRQKTRHYGASKFYTTKSKAWQFLIHVSTLAIHLFFVVLVIDVTSLNLILSLYFLRTLLIFYIFDRISTLLSGTIHRSLITFLEVSFTFFLWVIGIVALVSKRTRWS